MHRLHRDGYGNTRNITPRVSCRNGVFRGRKRLLLHHQCNRGGRPGCASRLNVDPAHSLPQQRSAGRNLITVFFTVNYLRAIFFAAVRINTNASPQPSLTTTPRMSSCDCQGAQKNHCKKALFQTHATSRPCMAHVPARHQCRLHDAKKKSLPDMQQAALRSTFPAMRKAFCANMGQPSLHFSPCIDCDASVCQPAPPSQCTHVTSRRRSFGNGNRRRKRIRKRPHKAAVSVDTCDDRNQWSSFSSSSA